MEYDGKAVSIWVQCPVPEESSAYLPNSYLVVPILVATQEIHCGTYVPSPIVGHNAPELLQVNKVLPPLENPFLPTRCLEKTVQGF